MSDCSFDVVSGRNPSLLIPSASHLPSPISDLITMKGSERVYKFTACHLSCRQGVLNALPAVPSCGTPGVVHLSVP